MTSKEQFMLSIGKIICYRIVFSHILLTIFEIYFLLQKLNTKYILCATFVAALSDVGKKFIHLTAELYILSS